MNSTWRTWEAVDRRTQTQNPANIEQEKDFSNLKNSLLQLSENKWMLSKA